jgi:putative transcriptional regulator
MSKIGKRLINAAKSAQAIAKGEADPKTYKVHVPAHLDVRAIRTKLKMSQNAFAARFASCHPRYAIGNRNDAILMEQRVSY